MFLIITLSALAGPCDDASSRACVESAVDQVLAGDEAGAEQLHDACKAGASEACFHRGVYALALGKDLEFVFDEAGHAALAAKCRAGTGAACYHLAALHERGPMDWRDQSQASMFYRQACGAGDARGCHAQATAYAAGGSKAGVQKATGLYSQACHDLDFVASCRSLAEISASSDPAAAKEARDRACALGDKESCG